LAGTKQSQSPSDLRSTDLKEAQEKALEQWKTDRIGPLAEFGRVTGLMYQKLEQVYESREFNDLPDEEQAFLRRPTIPSYKPMPNGPNFAMFFAPDKEADLSTLRDYADIPPKSRGAVTLQSSDPEVPLLFNPNLFSHPYDQKTALEATKEGFVALQSPDYNKGHDGQDRLAGRGQ
jgi:hypothetical protein